MELNIHQTNTDETDSMAKIEEPDNQVYGYIARDVADELGEYMTLTISEDEGAPVVLDSVTGKGTGNYAKYETPGGAIVGFGVSHDVWTEVLGEDVERDSDDFVTNAPESLSFQFEESSEEEYEESQAVPEDEVNALLGGGSDSDEGDSDEPEVEDEVEALTADD